MSIAFEVDNKLTQTDALSRVTTWAYDAINRPVSRTLPLGQVETYAYDENSNQTRIDQANGTATDRVFDELNKGDRDNALKKRQQRVVTLKLHLG